MILEAKLFAKYEPQAISLLSFQILRGQNLKKPEIDIKLKPQLPPNCKSICTKYDTRLVNSKIEAFFSAHHRIEAPSIGNRKMPKKIENRYKIIPMKIFKSLATFARSFMISVF